MVTKAESPVPASGDEYLQLQREILEELKVIARGATNSFAGNAVAGAAAGAIASGNLLKNAGTRVGAVSAADFAPPGGGRDFSKLMAEMVAKHGSRFAEDDEKFRDVLTNQRRNNMIDTIMGSGGTSGGGASGGGKQSGGAGIGSFLSSKLGKAAGILAVAKFATNMAGTPGASTDALSFITQKHAEGDEISIGNILSKTGNAAFTSNPLAASGWREFHKIVGSAVGNGTK